MKLENEIIDYYENKEDILHWAKLKGEYRYFSIIEFLKGKNIKCTWNNVTNYIKYDKRILNLPKNIGHIFIEFYRK